MRKLLGVMLFFAGYWLRILLAVGMAKLLIWVVTGPVWGRVE